MSILLKMDFCHKTNNTLGNSMWGEQLAAWPQKLVMPAVTISYVFLLNSSLIIETTLVLAKLFLWAELGEHLREKSILLEFSMLFWMWLAACSGSPPFGWYNGVTSNNKEHTNVSWALKHRFAADFRALLFPGSVNKHDGKNGFYYRELLMLDKLAWQSWGGIFSFSFSSFFFFFLNRIVI